LGRRQRRSGDLRDVEELRHGFTGRLDWTFFGSGNGGRTAAVLTSLLATCKRLLIDSFAYLHDIFECIAAHPKHRLEECLPDQWLAARTAVNS
jgi:hypothetical protein